MARRHSLLIALVSAALFASGLVTTASAAADPAVVAAEQDARTPVDAATSTGDGYWMLDNDGEVYPFGDARDYGDATSFSSSRGFAALAPTPDAGGYWILSRFGTLIERGNAPDLGNPSNARKGSASFAGVIATPTGKGLWTFTEDGEVVTLGDATHYGDLVGFPINGHIVDAAITPSGRGYWMLGSEGGIFAFGDADFQGSIQGVIASMGLNVPAEQWLNAPIVGLVPSPDGKGYWLVASDGGVFAFGNASFRGSVPGVISGPLAKPVNGMVPYGDGYLMVASDGGVFTFSNLPFLGSLGANPPDAAVIGISPMPTGTGISFPAIERSLYNTAETDAPLVSFLEGGGSAALQLTADGGTVVHVTTGSGQTGTVRVGTDGSIRLDLPDGTSVVASAVDDTTGHYTATKNGTVIAEADFPLGDLASVAPAAAPRSSSARTYDAAASVVVPVAAGFSVERSFATTSMGEEALENMTAADFGGEATCTFSALMSLPTACVAGSRVARSVLFGSKIHTDVAAIVRVPVADTNWKEVSDPTDCANRSAGWSVGGSVAGAVIVGLLIAWWNPPAAMAGAAAVFSLFGGATAGWFIASQLGPEARCAQIQLAVGQVKGLQSVGATRADIEACVTTNGPVALDFGQGDPKITNGCVNLNVDPFNQGDMDVGGTATLDATQRPIARTERFAQSTDGAECLRPRDVSAIGRLGVSVERINPEQRGRFRVRLEGNGTGTEIKSESCTANEVIEGTTAWSIDQSIAVRASNGRINLSPAGSLDVTSSGRIVSCKQRALPWANGNCVGRTSWNSSSRLGISSLVGTLTTGADGSLGVERIEITAAGDGRTVHLHAPASGTCTVSTSATGDEVSSAAASCLAGSPLQLRKTSEDNRVEIGEEARYRLSATGGYFDGVASYQVVVLVDGSEILRTTIDEALAADFVVTVDAGSTPRVVPVVIAVLDGSQTGESINTELVVTGPPECSGGGADLCPPVDPIAVAKGPGDWGIYRIEILSWHTPGLCGVSGEATTSYTVRHSETFLIGTDPWVQRAIDNGTSAQARLNKWGQFICEWGSTRQYDVEVIERNVNEEWAKQRFSQIADRLEARGYTEQFNRFFPNHWAIWFPDHDSTGSIRVGTIYENVG